MPTVTVGAQTIAYREVGSGFPALLLVHGAGGSSEHFDELLKVLGNASGHRRRCVALDLPGHGASPPPAVPASALLEGYRDVVAGAAEALGLGRFVLAGHSMGGAIAQHFALAFPERLAGLILIATAARLKVAPAVLSTIRERFEMLSTLLAAVAYSPATDKAQAQAWARGQIAAPQDVVLADFLACAEFDLRERVAAIRTPTLVISAADDFLTPPKLQEQLAALIPGARLESVSRSGHFLFYERPDLVAELILGSAPLAEGPEV